MSIFTHLAQAQYYTDYSDSYTDTTAMDGTTAAIIGGSFLVFMLFAGLVAYVVHSILLGLIFKKAGVPQWVAWVPFYNIWKTLELGGQAGFWAILLIIPFVNIVALVFYYIALYHIGLRLQKEGWFVLLAIFLPIVWYLWLAVDGSKWESGDKKAVAAK